MIKSLTVLLLLAGVGHAARQPNEPQLAWTLQSSDGGNILVTAWSSSASCVAVATDSTIDVIDVSGKRLWNWNFRQTNRFIRVTEYTSIAVSSNCDAVVLAGHVGYKYVWAADRRGMQTFFKTVGTPLATKFDINGDTVAVVTGASVGYLFSPRLEVRWSGRLSALPIRWPSQVVDRSETGATLFRREDVDVLFDALQWGYGVFDSVSDDGQWRAVWHIPFRGGGTGSVELWGPEAGGFRARYGRSGTPSQPRWIKPIGCPYGELTLAAAFVIVTGDSEHPNAVQLGDSPACDSGELSTYVFDRNGNTVLTWRHDQDPDQMGAAVFARTGKSLERWNPHSWDVPLTSDEVRSLPDTRWRLAYSPGGKMLLVSRDRELRLFSAPY